MTITAVIITNGQIQYSYTANHDIVEEHICSVKNNISSSLNSVEEAFIQSDQL